MQLALVGHPIYVQEPESLHGHSTNHWSHVAVQSSRLRLRWLRGRVFPAGDFALFRILECWHGVEGV